MHIPGTGQGPVADQRVFWGKIKVWAGGGQKEFQEDPKVRADRRHRVIQGQAELRACSKQRVIWGQAEINPGGQQRVLQEQNEVRMQSKKDEVLGYRNEERGNQEQNTQYRIQAQDAGTGLEHKLIEYGYIVERTITSQACHRAA